MKMKGTITKTDHVNVEVEPYDLLLTLKKHLLEKHNLPIDGYLAQQDGKPIIMVTEEEVFGSHSSYKEVVRVANPATKEVELYKALAFLRLMM
jgi:hypothetical protein